MEQYGRTCSECGRNLPASYSGELCAMCRQESTELQARPSATKSLARTGSSEPDTTSAGMYAPQVTLNMLAPHYQREIRGIAALERTNAVIWIGIAILQIISVVCALIGVYNIFVCIAAFSRAKDYENLEPFVPERERRALGSIIMFIFINLFLGGVIGVVACIIALVIRSRILKIREAFENPQACIGRQLYEAW
jgi:hypothetical protein